MPAWSRPRSSVFGRRPTAASRWLPVELMGAAAGVERDVHALAAVAGPDPRGRHREVEADALALEDRLHLARDLAVLAGDQPVAVFDHRHARAEAPVHLRELEADVAAAGDDQVLGQGVERHHRGVGQHRHVGEPVPVRQHRAAADVDEDLRRLERLAADLDRVRAGEARVAPEHAQVRRAGEPFAQPVDRIRDDRVLARLDRLHVDADRPPTTTP